MAVSLKKGQKVDLTKTNPGLIEIFAGLGWDTNKFDGGGSFDLDAAAFLIGENGKVTSDVDFVFYNQAKHPSGGVTHGGDNLTGEGEGDDEVIFVNLAQIPANIARVAFTVTIHEAQARGQNFGQVSNAFIRLVNQQTNEEIIRYDLSEDFSIETAVVVAELYRNGAEWKFNAVGAGYAGGLEALANSFGVSV